MTAKLICVFVFAYAKSRFSHNEAHIIFPFQSIQSDKGLHLRVLRAYRMMLDFYGIELLSSDTGEVTRADNYIERFDHLNRYIPH